MKKLFIISALTVLSITSLPTLAAETQYNFNVEGMTCASCIIRAEKEFKAMDGVKSINTDMDTNTVSVCANENITFNDEQVKAMFLEKGFIYKGMTKQEQC